MNKFGTHRANWIQIKCSNCFQTVTRQKTKELAMAGDAALLGIRESRKWAAPEESEPHHRCYVFLVIIFTIHASLSAIAVASITPSLPPTYKVHRFRCTSHRLRRRSSLFSYVNECCKSTRSALPKFDRRTRHLAIHLLEYPRSVSTTKRIPLRVSHLG
jgi:hypothetical protein